MNINFLFSDYIYQRYLHVDYVKFIGVKQKKFKIIIVNQKHTNFYTSYTKISSFDDRSALVLAMAFLPTGDKPLHEPMI